MTNVVVTEEQKNKLMAATKRYFARVRSISRKHRANIAGLLRQADDKRVQAIKSAIEKKV